MDIVNHPACPWVCVMRRNPYDLSGTEPLIVWKQLWDWFILDTQLLMDFMTATTDRAEGTDKLEKSLGAHAATIAKSANTTTVRRVKEQLSAPDLEMFADIKAELLKLMVAGKIQKLTDLDIDRITLMRLLETKGILHILNANTSEVGRDEVTLLETMRKYGESSQKMIDNNSDVQKSGKSIFDSVQDLVKSGVDIHLSKKQEPEIIDAEFVEHQDAYDDMVDDYSED